MFSSCAFTPLIDSRTKSRAPVSDLANASICMVLISLLIFTSEKTLRFRSAQSNPHSGTHRCGHGDRFDKVSLGRWRLGGFDAIDKGADIIDKLAFIKA